MAVDSPTGRELVDYLTDAAFTLGFGPRPGKKAEELDPPTGVRDMDWQSGYSLAWYFNDYLERDLGTALAGDFGDGIGLPPLESVTVPSDEPTDDPLVAFLGLGRLDAAPAPASYRAAARREDAMLERLFPGDANGLNAKQREALHKALHNKVSIIKGPPGTGKTEVIMHIIALAVRRGETVAVVSSNNSAVRNVVDKATESYEACRAGAGAGAEAGDDAGAGLEGNLAAWTATKLAALGSAEVRAAWRPIGATAASRGKDGRVFARKPRGTAAGPGGAKCFPGTDRPYIAGAETEITFDVFTRDHPLVTSTIHSLKKCFADGAERRYDLLIMDEASQTNVIQGVVALSCAKRVVIVGDEEQLPPVVNDAYAGALAELADHYHVPRRTGDGDGRSIPSPYDLTDPENSFLTACYRVFDPLFARRKAELEVAGGVGGDGDGAGNDIDIDTDVTTTLTEHYRCPEAIIEFCNRYVYRGVLKPAKTRRPGDPVFPLALRWYDGDYREGSWLGRFDDGVSGATVSGATGTSGKPVKPRDGSARRSSSTNDKQLTVFRMEELPYLKRRLEESAQAGETLSVCLLTPFRGQQEWLERLLRRELKGIVDDKDIAMERLDGGTGNGNGNGTGNDSDAGDAGRPDADASPSPHGGERAQALTIHKSQGQGFDIVYLLPVEDGNWEWPWSQGRHLINVAVSRAKRELRVIASTTLMSGRLQRRLTGAEIPASAPADEAEHDRRNQQMFIRKLADYIADNAPVDGEGWNLEPDFGVIRSGVRSVFDIRPAVQEHDRAFVRRLEGRGDRQRATQFAPENIVMAVSSRIAEAEGLVMLHTVKWPDVLLPDGTALADVDKNFDRYKDPSNTEFDVVLVRPDGRIVIAVEADGVYHRFARRMEPQDLTPFERRQEDMRRMIHRLAATGGSEPGPGGVPRTYPPREDVIERDLLKDRIVIFHAHGTVAHLGADSSSPDGDRRPYLTDTRLRILRRRLRAIAGDDGVVRGRGVFLGLPVPTADGDPDHAVAEPFADDVFTPDGLADVRGLVMLRVPSDGSTYLETDALRRGAVTGVATNAGRIPARPTIEDYVRACDAVLDADDHFTLRVRPERLAAGLDDGDRESIRATRAMLERYEAVAKG